MLPTLGALRDKIHALLARANHPNTPQAEAETALALASRLMLKHGLTDDDLIEADPATDIAVRCERVAVAGKYRVQRQHLLYAVARRHNCVGYRDDDEDGACVLVLFGRAADLLAARTLFTAAEMLAARVLPRGDRSARTAWWQGFRSGLEEALGVARREFVDEHPGTGLVLADRMKRAENEMRASAPALRTTYSRYDAGSEAYRRGRHAGRSFPTAGRSFTNGVRGELSR